MARPEIFAGASRFQANELARPVLDVARDLLGSYVVRVLDGEWLVGRIVETEAYEAATDPACHGFRGLTPRSRPIFGPPGLAYVYRIYGMHDCFNVVCEPEGVGAAVLVRALEPVSGVARMQGLRGGVAPLTSGPGRLCQALAIDRSFNEGSLLVSDALFLLRGPVVPPEALGVSPRIGINVGAELPWRFFERDNRHVSKGPMWKGPTADQR